MANHNIQEITVTENWIKPPKMVTYTNSKLITRENNVLVCEFSFPHKYASKPFYVQGVRVLEANEMFYGRRTFYDDRFYSTLEFFDKNHMRKAMYYDITLPAILGANSCTIVDIKLDIFHIRSTHAIFLLDEDEFNGSYSKQSFTQEEIAIAKRTTTLIMSLLKETR